MTGRRRDHRYHWPRRDALHGGFAALMVLALLVGAVGMTPQPATASNLKPRLVEKLFTIPAGETRAKLVACPQRYLAVSGGVRPLRLNPNAFVVASAPTGASGRPAATESGARPNHWLGTINNLSGRSEQARVFVLCVPAKATSSVRPYIEATDVVLDPGPGSGGGFIGMSGEGRVNCGEGARVVGGGVAPITQGALARTHLISSGPLRGGTDPVDIYDLQSGDSPGSWYANFTLFKVPAATFRIFAICVAGLDSSDLVLRITDFTAPAQAVSPTASRVACRDDERVIGGGVLGPTYTYSTMQDTGPALASGSGRRVTAWRAAVRNGSFSPATYRALAICQPPENPTP